MIDPGFSILRDMREIEMSSVERLEASGRLVAGTAAAEASRIPVIVDPGEEPVARLQAAGLVVRSTIGRIVTADMDLRLLSMLSELHLRRVEMACPVPIDGNAPGPDIHRSDELARPALSGRNVVIGIVGSGIDWHRPIFRDTGDRSRILAIWDQSLTAVGDERAPNGFGYGVEYFRSHFDQVPDGRLAVRHADDRSGCGSRVAGMVGSIAPEADIVSVCNRSANGRPGNTVTMLEAVRYVLGVARQAGKPCVILPGTGSEVAAWATGSLLDSDIDGQAARPCQVIVQPGADAVPHGRHVQGAVPAGGRQILSLCVPASDGTPEIIDISYDAGDRLELSVTDPTGHVFASVAPGIGVVLQAPSGNRLFVQSRIDANSTGQSRIQVQITPGTAGLVVSGAWIVGLTSLRGGMAPTRWQARIRAGERTASFAPVSRGGGVAGCGGAAGVAGGGSVVRFGMKGGPDVVQETLLGAAEAAGLVALMLSAVPALTVEAMRRCLGAADGGGTGPAVNDNDGARRTVGVLPAIGRGVVSGE